MNKSSNVQWRKSNRKKREGFTAPSYSLQVTLSISDSQNVKKHALALIDFIDNGLGEPNSSVDEALDYFGFEVTFRESRDAYDDFKDYFAVNPTLYHPNPALNPDFFDLLRELDTLLIQISDHIRSINDHDRFSTDVKAVLAYIDSFRAFIDVERDQPPDEIPAAISFGLSNRLEKINWSEFSENMRKWVETAIKLLGKLIT